MKRIPNDLRGILWSAPLEKLDIQKHKSYIIHQVLMFGDFHQIRWLFDTYTKKQIRAVFQNQPQKIYTPQALNFIGKFILDLAIDKQDQHKYVNTLY